MFLQRFSFKTGLPLFAHRFRYTFKAYLINGSSVFLKIDESPKKIVKNKNLSILKSIHNLYLNKKEVLLDFFVKELDKTAKSTKKLTVPNKLIDKKIDKYTVEILNKRIYTVEKNNLNVYKTNSLLDYIEMDKNKLRKTSHNISTINSININGITYEIYIPNNNLTVSSDKRKIVYNTISTLLETKYRFVNTEGNYFQISNESMKELNLESDLIELYRNNKNHINVYNTINNLVKNNYKLDLATLSIKLGNENVRSININNIIYDIYKNSLHQIKKDTQKVHHLDTIVIKDINKNSDTLELVKRVIRSGNNINTINTLSKDGDKNISKLLSGWKFIRKEPTWEISKPSNSFNINKDTIKDITVNNEKVYFKKTTMMDTSFKFLVYSLLDISKVNIDYNTKISFLQSISRKDLSLVRNDYYLHPINEKDIFNFTFIDYLEKINNQNLFIDVNDNFLINNSSKSVTVTSNNQYLFKSDLKNIINDSNLSKYYSPNAVKDINKINKTFDLDKHYKFMSNPIHKDFNLNIKQPEGLFETLSNYYLNIDNGDNFIFIPNSEFLSNFENKIISVNYNNYNLFKSELPNITNNYNYSLDKLNYIKIDKRKFISVKDILNPNIDINIVKKQLRLVEGKRLDKFKYIDSVNFLTLNKRWWFIKPTNPKTRINIPSIDYPYENKPVMDTKKHPIQAFKDLGTNDIDVSIEILLELVNIVMHWWHHSYNELYRGLGDESIIGIMNVLNEWWSLESSQNQVNDDKTNKEYERVFRWIRWEAEKIYFDFKKDYQNNLIYNGNHYMEIFTKNLLEYIEFHHYMIVPLYKSLDRMDIMRAIMDDDPQGDVMIELPDKNKGERDYIIDSEDNNYLL